MIRDGAQQRPSLVFRAPLGPTATSQLSPTASRQKLHAIQWPSDALYLSRKSVSVHVDRQNRDRRFRTEARVVCIRVSDTCDNAVLQ